MSNEPRSPIEPDTGVLSAATAELDIVESGKRKAQAPLGQVRPPVVRLGALEEGGLAPAIMAIVERGVRRRPALARTMHAEIEFVFEERYPPARVVFGDRLVLIEDGHGKAPDLKVTGSLPDLISMMAAPLLGGVPSPINARGRAALGMVALGRVRLEGRLGLMRRLLAIIKI